MLQGDAVEEEVLGVAAARVRGAADLVADERRALGGQTRHREQVPRRREAFEDHRAAHDGEPRAVRAA